MRRLTSFIVKVERKQPQAQPQRVDDTAKQEDSHNAMSEPERKARKNPLGGLFHRTKDDPDAKDASIASSTEKDDSTQRRSQGKTDSAPSSKSTDRNIGTFVSEMFRHIFVSYQMAGVY
jgi:hypothetical protein